MLNIFLRNVLDFKWLLLNHFDHFENIQLLVMELVILIDFKTANCIYFNDELNNAVKFR